MAHPGYVSRSVGGVLCYRGLIFHSNEQLQSELLGPVCLHVMHSRCFEDFSLSAEREVGESGRALMDGLHSLSADDRLDLWEASAELHSERETTPEQLMSVYMRGGGASVTMVKKSLTVHR